MVELIKFCKSKKGITSLLLLAICILILTRIYLVLNNTEVSLEFKKEHVTKIVFAFCFFSSLALPLLFYMVFASDSFVENDPRGEYIRGGTILLLFLVTPLVICIVNPWIERKIDPNHLVKQVSVNKLTILKKESELRSIKIKNKIETYEELKRDLNEYNELCDLPEIELHIDRVNSLLVEQLKELNNMKSVILKSNMKADEYFKFVDSVYEESNRLKQGVSDIINENTWYRRELFIHYLLSFIFGLLANATFHYIMNTKIDSKKGDEIKDET